MKLLTQFLRNQRGFTMIEMVVAAALSAVVLGTAGLVTQKLKQTERRADVVSALDNSHLLNLQQSTSAAMILNQLKGHIDFPEIERCLKGQGTACSQFSETANYSIPITVDPTNPISAQLNPIGGTAVRGIASQERIDHKTVLKFQCWTNSSCDSASIFVESGARFGNANLGAGNPGARRINLTLPAKSIVRSEVGKCNDPEKSYLTGIDFGTNTVRCAKAPEEVKQDANSSCGPAKDNGMIINGFAKSGLGSGICRKIAVANWSQAEGWPSAANTIPGIAMTIQDKAFTPESSISKQPIKGDVELIVDTSISMEKSLDQMLVALKTFVQKMRTQLPLGSSVNVKFRQINAFFRDAEISYTSEGPYYNPRAFLLNQDITTYFDATRALSWFSSNPPTQVTDVRDPSTGNLIVVNRGYNFRANKPFQELTIENNNTGGATSESEVQKKIEALRSGMNQYRVGVGQNSVNESPICAMLKLAEERILHPSQDLEQSRSTIVVNITDELDALFPHSSLINPETKKEFVINNKNLGADSLFDCPSRYFYQNVPQYYPAVDTQILSNTAYESLYNCVPNTSNCTLADLTEPVVGQKNVVSIDSKFFGLPAAMITYTYNYYFDPPGQGVDSITHPWTYAYSSPIDVKALGLAINTNFPVKCSAIPIPNQPGKTLDTFVKKYFRDQVRLNRAVGNSFYDGDSQICNKVGTGNTVCHQAYDADVEWDDCYISYGNASFGAWPKYNKFPSKTEFENYDPLVSSYEGKSPLETIKEYMGAYAWNTFIEKHIDLNLISAALSDDVTSLTQTEWSNARNRDVSLQELSESYILKRFATAFHYATFNVHQNPYIWYREVPDSTIRSHSFRDIMNSGKVNLPPELSARIHSINSDVKNDAAYYGGVNGYSIDEFIGAMKGIHDAAYGENNYGVLSVGCFAEDNDLCKSSANTKRVNPFGKKMIDSFKITPYDSQFQTVQVSEFGNRSEEFAQTLLDFFISRVVVAEATRITFEASAPPEVSDPQEYVAMLNAAYEQEVNSGAYVRSSTQIMLKGLPYKFSGHIKSSLINDPNRAPIEREIKMGTEFRLGGEPSRDNANPNLTSIPHPFEYFESFYQDPVTHENIPTKGIRVTLEFFLENPAVKSWLLDPRSSHVIHLDFAPEAR